MSARARKFFGMIAILAFMIAYILAASVIGDVLPDHWAVRLAYYAIAGTAWGLPLFPLIRWMSRAD